MKALRWHSLACTTLLSGRGIDEWKFRRACRVKKIETLYLFLDNQWTCSVEALIEMDIKVAIVSKLLFLFNGFGVVCW